MTVDIPTLIKTKGYTKLFEELGADGRTQLLEAVKNEENRYREIFAQDRESLELKDPHVLLLNPHECQNIFK